MLSRRTSLFVLYSGASFCAQRAVFIVALYMLSVFPASFRTNRNSKSLFSRLSFLYFLNCDLSSSLLQRRTCSFHYMFFINLNNGRLVVDCIFYAQCPEEHREESSFHYGLYLPIALYGTVLQCEAVSWRPYVIERSFCRVTTARTFCDLLF